MEFKIAVVVIVIVLMAVTTTPFVYAKHLSDQNRYDSGMKDGVADCGNSAVIDSYRQSSSYLGHSELYQQGYDAGAYSCGGVISSPGYVSDNSHHNQNSDNRNQAQGQASKQHVLCVSVFGSCNTTNGQSQGLSN